MAIEHEPQVSSGTVQGFDDSLLEQIATAYDMDTQAARLETLRQGRLFNMSAHNLWLGEAWATILFTSMHVPQANGPIVSLTVNKELPADALKKLYIEDFFALPHSGHIKLRHDVLERQDIRRPWPQNVSSGPLLEVKAPSINQPGIVDVSAGVKYKNAIFGSSFLPNLKHARNLADAQKMVSYLSLLDADTCLEGVERVTRRCVA